RDRRDAGQRTCPGILGRGPGQARPQRAARAGAADGAPVLRHGAGHCRAQRGRAGRPAAGGPIRADAARTVRALRLGGISRVVMAPGARADAADRVGVLIGVDEVLAERTPAEKLDAVRLERRRAPTIMVGDGINDAPALALADVGVAMGSRGATASSEAADVVITADRLDRVGEARALAHR